MNTKLAQPFSYQQSNGSCWITSVHNGLIHLLGTSTRIEHFISRYLYILTSAEGTFSEEARILVKLINENKRLGIQARIIQCETIDEERLRRFLGRRKSVLITDTLSGTHSILLLRMERDDIIAFDPDWDNVKDCKVKKGCYVCCPFEMVNSRMMLNPYFNARIHIDHFLKTRTLGDKDQRFVMGANSERFIIELIRK